MQLSFVHMYFHREFMVRVQDGKMKIWMKHWPSFLFDEGDYDRNNWERGLFKGYLLLQVCLSSTMFSTKYDCFLMTGIPPHFYQSIAGYRKDKKRNKTQQSTNLQDEMCDWLHNRICLCSGKMPSFYVSIV